MAIGILDPAIGLSVEMTMRGTTIALILALAAPAAADVLTTTSGRKLTGTIIGEDANSVTFEINGPGLSVREVFKRDDIASITKPAEVAGPSYYEIPVMGYVGLEVTAKGLGNALAAARAAKASHVVLLFDSPGGSVGECEQIIDVMDQNRDLNTIAYIKTAYSAAAVVAVTCKTIVMYPTGQIGAAVPYMITPKGTPVDINEKMTSAIRARARSAAAIGGHDPELLMGMIDTKIELYATEGPLGPTISEQKEPGATLIKAKDKILTLTAEEATKYGLAKGIARGMSELGKQVDIEQWTSCGRQGWEIMQSSGAAQRATVGQAVKAQQDERLQEATNKLTGMIKVRIREAQAQIEQCEAEEKRLDEFFKKNTESVPRNAQLYKVHETNYQQAKQKVQDEKKKWQIELDSARQMMRRLGE